ncbi:hypothetical protein PENSPDRAFT_681764 [Peniophora sp. CONT]|nr:hypothetical protein PENSPDRAFT_681764 [Peniophora sp. CONT]
MAHLLAQYFSDYPMADAGASEDNSLSGLAVTPHGQPPLSLPAGASLGGGFPSLSTVMGSPKYSATSQTPLDANAIAAGLSAQQLYSSGNTSFQRAMAIAQQLKHERDQLANEKAAPVPASTELLEELAMAKGKLALMQDMYEKRQANSNAVPWNLPFNKLPDLDKDKYPRVLNWFKKDANKSRGTSTGNEAPIVPDAEDIGGEDVKPAGMGRGKHGNKRKKSDGTPQAGLLAFLVNDEGDDEDPDEKEEINRDANGLFAALLARGEAKDKYGDFEPAVTRFFEHSLEDAHFSLRLCAKHWKVRRYLPRKYASWAQKRMHGNKADTSGPPPSKRVKQKMEQSEDAESLSNNDMLTDARYSFKTPAPTSDPGFSAVGTLQDGTSTEATSKSREGSPAFAAPVPPSQTFLQPTEATPASESNPVGGITPVPATSPSDSHTNGDAQAPADLRLTTTSREDAPVGSTTVPSSTVTIPIAGSGTVFQDEDDDIDSGFLYV